MAVDRIRSNGHELYAHEIGETMPGLCMTLFHVQFMYGTLLSIYASMNTGNVFYAWVHLCSNIYAPKHLGTYASMQ